MGCVCCTLSSFVSILLNAAERAILCTVLTMLVCCLVFTILTVLVMGIGIGYHYCTVQHSYKAMEAAAKATGDLVQSHGGPENSPVMRSVNKAIKRGFAHRLGKRDMDDLMPSNNNTVNDDILQQNFTILADRLRQTLEPSHLHSNMNETLCNLSLLDIQCPHDVELYFNTSRTNRIKREMVDDFDDTPENLYVSNMTIEEAKLKRQNCNVLTFFNRFF